ncbi:MAG: twin-arginine translocase subunit TatC [Pirellulales bacterium]
MSRISDDDFFKDSTMSFGEHLEELRGALFRAVVGLFIGVAIGLYFGNWVVEIIQYPLKKALIKYYQNQAATDAVKAGFVVGDETTEEKIETFQKKLVALGMVSEVKYDVTPAMNPAAAQDAGDRTRRHLLRLAAEREIGNRGFYTPEAFPDLPPELRTDAARYASLSDDELKKFQQAVLDYALPAEKPAVVVPPEEKTKEEKQAEEKSVARLVYSKIEDYEPLKVKSMNIQEGFMIYLKAALLFGLVLSSPWVFYQIWLFVAAGLYPNERKYVSSFLPMSLGLFLLGASTAFFLVFEPVLDYLLGINKWLGIDPDPRINEWLGFALVLPLGFGISFQLPLVMLFLERIGIFKIETYLAKWRVSILVICILSAILTPADPYSMLFMAGPLVVLFFGGILLCKLFPRKAPE